MPKLEQIIPISGPMIDTIDNESIPSSKGLVRKRINIRPDVNGNVYANRGIPGTTAIDITLPAGTNKTLGWCNDNENEAIIIFVWNSNNNHCIYRLFTLSETTQFIRNGDPQLGFTENSNIKAEVVDGRLYWNDNVSHPKSFNIQNAISNSYTSVYAPLSEVVYPMIKKSPQFKPQAEFESRIVDPDDSTVSINFNNLRKKQWQFKYCYVYEDFQQSVYSSFSETLLPNGDFAITGEWDSNITSNNCIRVMVDTGSALVKKINVAVKDVSNLNTGAFHIFKVIDKFDENGVQIINDNTTTDAYFLNNGLLENIDTSYGNAYFHNIPLKARDMMLLNGRYLSMSMPEYGYDLEEESLDYSIDAVEYTSEFELAGVPMSIDSSQPSISYNLCGGDFSGRGYIEYKITIPEEFYKESVYTIFMPDQNGQFGSEHINMVTASVTTGATQSVNYPKNVRDSLILQLLNSIDRCYIFPIGITKEGDNILVIRYYRIGYVAINEMLANPNTTVKALISTGTRSNAYRALKRGQYHPFGIVYNDGEGRYNIAFGDKKIFVPAYDLNTDADTESKYYLPRINITSRPPVWAKTWRAVYIPYNSYLYTITVPAIEQVEGEGVDVETNGIPTGKSFLKINQAIAESKELFPNNLVSDYVWENGDRLRHLGYPESYEILQEYTRTYKQTAQATESITETGYLIETPLPLVDGTIFVRAVEIYRPNLTPQNKIYYETGDEFEILEPGTATRRHAGNFQNQSADLTTSAISDLDFGDVYFRQRITASAFIPQINVEDNHYSDYFISSGTNIGRGTVRTRSENKVVRRVVKTENYIENTEFNRLNIMLAGNEYFQVSEVYGDIYGTVERGDTIKVFQAHKETSVYVGKVYAKDSGGGDIKLDADNVFGSEQPAHAFIGTSYPKSIGTMDSYVYYFDVTTGDFIRSAMNGSINLATQYGFDKYFTEKAEAFRSYTGNKDILFGAEKGKNMVYLTFIMGADIETIAFSEDETNKGFLFFVQFSNAGLIPEYFAYYGDNMYSTVNGKPYRHGSGAVNSFYGSDRKTGELQFVANNDPVLRKTFEVMAVDTNGNWSAELTIEPDDNYPNGQRTVILPKMWKSHEGSKTSGIPMNIVTPNGNTNMQRLYSGNKMSGSAMDVKISSADFDILRKIKITTINQV